MVCSTMGLQGRRQCQVGAEMPEKAHTWTGHRPQGADEAAATDGAAAQVAAPGGSRNAGNGSYLDGTQATDAAAGHTPLPGGSGNAGKGSYLEGKQATDTVAGHTLLPGGSGNAEIGSHLDEEAATEGGCVPPAASSRLPPTKQRGPFPGVKMLFCLIVFSLLANGADAIAAAYPIGNRFDG